MSKYPTGYVLPKGCCIIVCYLQTTENRISSVHYWVDGTPKWLLQYIFQVYYLKNINTTFYFQIFYRYVNDAVVKPSHVQLIKLSDMQMFNLTAGNTTCFVQQIWIIISTSVGYDIRGEYIWRVVFMGTPTLHLDLEKILNQPTYPEVLVNFYEKKCFSWISFCFWLLKSRALQWLVAF